MLILAFESAKDAENGGAERSGRPLRGADQPRDLHARIQGQDLRRPGPGHQRRAVQVRVHDCPRSSTFDFLFDNTGLIDGKPKPDGIFDDVDAFRRLLTEYQGDSHEPYHLKLVWGNLIFKGRAIEVGITYKLFNPDGQPIRAVVRVKFKGSIEEQKRAALEDTGSPPTSPSPAHGHARRHPAVPVLPRSTATRGTTCGSPPSTSSTTSAAWPSAGRSCSRP